MNDRSPNGPATPYVPISWGELIDKITILEIKLEKIESAAARVNVSNELQALRKVLESEPGLAASLETNKQRLRQVNEALWDVEEQLRAKEKSGDFGASFVQLARSVYRLNDHRAALKRDLNAISRSELVEEKSYERERF